MERAVCGAILLCCWLVRLPHGLVHGIQKEKAKNIIRIFSTYVYTSTTKSTSAHIYAFTFLYWTVHWPAHRNGGPARLEPVSHGLRRQCRDPGRAHTLENLTGRAGSGREKSRIRRVRPDRRRSFREPTRIAEVLGWSAHICDGL